MDKKETGLSIAVKELKEQFRAEMLEACAKAEWYRTSHYIALAENEKIKHRAYFDTLDILDLEAYTALTKLDENSYRSFGNYEYYLRSGFTRLAELEMLRHDVYSHMHCDLKKLIALNS